MVSYHDFGWLLRTVAMETNTEDFQHCSDDLKSLHVSDICHLYTLGYFGDIFHCITETKLYCS